jgi:hypothetical protein
MEMVYNPVGMTSVAWIAFNERTKKIERWGEVGTAVASGVWFIVLQMSRVWVWCLD